MIDLEEIKKRLEKEISPSVATIRDLDGGGQHYEIVVVSKLFEDKNPLARHRMVNKALEGILGTQMHAARILTYSPQETSTSHP